jgi:hypothetical protein
MKTALSALGLILLAACSHAPPALQVGDVAYSESRLVGLTPERRQALGELTAFGLAVAKGDLDTLGAPWVQEREDSVKLDILAADLLLEQNGVGDDVLRARYLTNPSYELTVRHILFRCDSWEPAAKQAAAKAKAERALTLVRAGADFAQTAARLSEEPGASASQGLLPPGREGSWVDPFWEAASALNVGEISGVVHTIYGYHILKLEARRMIPFSEERSRVARDVAAQIGHPRDVLAAWVASHANGASLSNAAGREVALAEAERRKITVRPAEAKSLQLEWSDDATAWASVLGFVKGATPDQVGDAALRALGLPTQNATLARDAIGQLGTMLQARYPIQTAQPAG